MVLSPKSKRIYDRQHRPSFQGLAVIEGNGQNEKYEYVILGNDVNRISQLNYDRLLNILHLFCSFL